MEMLSDKRQVEQVDKRALKVTATACCSAASGM
jgi:hypothetical protein